MNTNRFFTSLFFLLFILSSATSIAQTKLVFFTEDASLFYLYLNGQLQNKVALEQVSVDNLSLQDYKVTIEYRDLDKDPIEYTTTLKKDRENIFIIHEGDVRNKVELYSVSKKGEYSPTTKPASYKMQGYNGKLGCAWPIGSKEINSIVNEVKGQKVEQAKVSIVKQTVLNKCLTVEQFAGLLEHFDEDPDKVYLAKYSISYLYDRENYEDIAGVFKSHRNMDKVRRYVEERRVKP